MKILAVDIGTGTQDILLFDTELDPENGFKLVLPSPTMMVHRRLKGMLPARTPVLLSGHQMGGGPSTWAIEEYARAGVVVYMTPSAALTLNDDLEMVKALGIRIVTEQESLRLQGVERIHLKDFDFPLISRTFLDYGVSLNDLRAIAVAVFDHGNAPPGVSDRKFRFDYLDRRIRQKNSLSAFAYRAQDLPSEMTRLQSVADSAGELPCPLVVMDTAPAAVLGAEFDPVVAGQNHKIICNIGNFHTLAFRLGEAGIEGIFEHHTGEINQLKLLHLLRALASGTLRNEHVFNDMGHGALMYSSRTFEFGLGEFDVVVTGPRRRMFDPAHADGLRPYFATPFGDMMIAGCYGLLAATAELLPELAEPILSTLQGRSRQAAPWDAG